MNVYSYITDFIFVGHSADNVAEWLRRQPAKLMCFARECSNHSDIEFMFLLKHAERTYVRSYPGRGSLDQSVDDRTVLLTFTGWTVS